jgi:hypothetical protein
VVASFQAFTMREAMRECLLQEREAKRKEINENITFRLNVLGGKKEKLVSYSG